MLKVAKGSWGSVTVTTNKGDQHCYNQGSSLDRTPSGAQLCTPTCITFPSLGQSSEWAFLSPTVNFYMRIMAKELRLSGRCWHIPIWICS